VKPEGYMTIREVASLLDVSNSLVRGRVKQGLLRDVRVGYRRYFCREDVERLAQFVLLPYQAMLLLEMGEYCFWKWVSETEFLSSIKAGTFTYFNLEDVKRLRGLIKDRITLIKAAKKWDISRQLFTPAILDGSLPSIGFGMGYNRFVLQADVEEFAHENAGMKSGAAAKALGLNQRQLYNRMERDMIRFTRDTSGRYRFKQADIDLYLAEYGKGN
jgi:excisionase family DNA binding protein